MRHTALPDVEMVDCDQIKVFVSRERDPIGFRELKDSIARNGLKMPVQLRSIEERPAAERKRPEGGLYRYELIAGQGRVTAFKELGKKRIPALVLDVPEVEVVSRFLAENMIRESLPWSVKARLIEGDLKEGRTYAEIAEDLSISPKHAQKLHHLLRSTSADVRKDLLSMAVNEVEQIVTLPVEDQKVVVEALRETDQKEIAALVKRAKIIRKETGELSAMALKKSLQRVDEDLKKVRDSLKPIRLHHALGPQNVQILLSDPKFRKAAEAAKVPFHKLESLMK